MTESTGTSAASFPVTTAFELSGVTVERDLGVAFGLVVRSMRFDSSELGQGLTEIVACGTAVVVHPTSA